MGRGRSQTACIFSGGIRPGLQSDPSPSAEHIFLPIFFLRGRARFSVHVSGVREPRHPPSRGPRPCVLEDPGAWRLRGRRRWLVSPGCAGARSPPPAGPGLPDSPVPARPSGPWARGRLDGSPCRSARCAPLHPGLRTSPPTCSRLLTSRAAGTMGWGCHSNRLDVTIRARVPPPRRAAGAAAATLGRLRDSGCGVRWAERPGLCGKRGEGGREEGGRDGRVEVWGG